MANPKKLEWTALFGLFMQIVFTGVCFALFAVSKSAAVYAEVWHLCAGIPVWLIVLLHGRQGRLAGQEAEELAQLKKDRLSEELFDETELDAMRARSGLLFFEKYLVPILSLLVSALLAYLTYHLVKTVWFPAEKIELARPAAVAVGMVFVTFLGFVIGKYAAGLAQHIEYRLLRASAGFLLGNVAAGLLVTVAMGAAHFNIFWPERVVTFIIPILMGLVSVEIILNLILDIYRPRVPGQPRRPPYDSRLLGLFGEPGGMLKTVATTLDYQFGFKVSETWFYRFMERAIVPIVLIELVALWLLTALVPVGPDEVAFIERFGRPRVSAKDAGKAVRASVYAPGFHLKAPWPFEIARYVPAYQVQTMELGKIYYEEGETPQYDESPLRVGGEDVVLWTERHIDPELGYEADFLVPSMEQIRERTEDKEEEPEEGKETTPEINLARLLAHIHFRVKRLPDGSIDPAAAYEYYYGHADPNLLIEDLSYSVLCRIAAGQDFLKWIAEERGMVNERFRTELQEALDRQGLGVELVFAGLPVVHPPPETAHAYEAVINSYQTKETLIYGGTIQAKRLVEGARAQAAFLRGEAQGYGYRLRRLAKADAERFEVQMSAYNRAPKVYRYRKYFSVVEDFLAGHRLYVVPVSRQEVDVIDLHEKLRPDILDFDFEEGAK